ncbi:hypothetical protein BJ741DRAFT_651543 [Chytriomyces cf. hyalinus JEL632]|nr:hypothetical protein BJ741DRAFT_651543 [Chytriomyces cf. hyalinus JEL632]
MKVAFLAWAVAASVHAAPVTTSLLDAQAAAVGAGQAGRLIREPIGPEENLSVPAPVQKFDFFTVDPPSQKGSACQGFLGLVTLYQGGQFSIKWAPTYFATGKFNPSSMDLFLSLNTNDTSLDTSPFYLAQNKPIDASTSSINVSLPLNNPKRGSYSLKGSFYDTISATRVPFHDNTKEFEDNINVVVLPPDVECDLQLPQVTTINVALAAGLGGGISALLIIFIAISAYRSRLLMKRERKGKFWVDGPHSKHSQKENLFDATLNRIRYFAVSRKAAKRKAAGENDDGEASESEDEQTSTTEGDSYVMDTLSSATNPFITDDEKVSNKLSSTFDSVVPLKDDSSSAEESKEKSKRKGKQSAVKKSEFGLSSRFGFSKRAEKDEESKGSEKSNQHAAFLNSSVVRDPVTGQVRTFVFLDSRGPPVRNCGGSSSWAPPENVLNVRHRVLTAFTPSHPDELTVVRTNLVVVEAVLEDGWAVVYKIDDPNAPKAEAVNRGKKGDSKLVGKMPSVPLMATSPDAVSWGKRVLGFSKDTAGEDLGPLGDAATGSKRGLVPYNILFVWPEPFGSRKPGGGH